jgi:hypothetical protein
MSATIDCNPLQRAKARCEASGEVDFDLKLLRAFLDSGRGTVKAVVHKNAAKVRFEPTFPIFCAAAKVCLQGNIRLLAVLAIDAKEVVGRYLDNSTRQTIASTI